MFNNLVIGVLVGIIAIIGLVGRPRAVETRAQ